MSESTTAMLDNMSKSSVEVPQELQYRLPASKKSMITARHELSRSPTGTTSGITPGQTISFLLPPNANRVLDSRHTFFSMTVTDATATDRIGGPVTNLINRLRILTDNEQVLEDIQGYNIISKILQQVHYSKNYLEHVERVGGYEPDESLVYANLGSAAMGLAVSGNAAIDGATPLNVTDANVGAAASNLAVVRSRFDTGPWDAESSLEAGKTFFFRLDASGLLNAERMYPLMVSGLRIELTLEAGATAFRVYTGTYTVSNPKIYYTVLQLNDQLSASMSQAIRKGTLYLPFSTFYNKLDNRNASSFNIDFNQPLYRVREMYCVRRLVSELTTGFDSFRFVSTDFSESFWKYGDQYIPVDKISSLRHAYLHLKNSLNHQGSTLHSSLPFYMYENGGSCVFASNFQTLISDPFSGVSTKNSKSIEFNLALSNAANSRIDCYVLAVRVMSVSADGSISIFE